MGVNATLKDLAEHLSPPFNPAERRRPTDMDIPSLRRNGALRLRRLSSTNIRSRTVSSSATVVRPTSPSIWSPSSTSAPTNAIHFSDILGESSGKGRDINCIYQYLASMESELFPQINSAVDGSVEQWLAKSDNYVEELIRLEGRGRFISHQCNGCGGDLDRGVGLRCDDCNDLGLYCLTCCLDVHIRHPLHRLRRWTGDRFEVVELALLGLRVHLGHGIGQRCPNPDLGVTTSFVVLDLSGVHEVAVIFCGCEGAVPHHVQLLRHRMFPATFTEPRTAATFQLLEHFTVLSSQSNVSPLGYYRTLVRVTINNGVSAPTNRLTAFLVMSREWQVLKTLKRSGAGNNAGGVAATSQDDCALECPACSSPSKDLSDANIDIAPKQSWISRLSSIICSRIRSKRGAVSSHGRLDGSFPENGADTVTTCPHGLMRVRPAANILDKSELVESPLATSILLPDDSDFLAQSDEKPPGSVSQPTSDDEKCQKQPQIYEDVFDVALASWNWDKLTALPITLLLNAEDTQVQRDFYERVLTAIVESVPGVCVDMWREMLTEWQTKGELVPNPFNASRSHLSRAQVRLDLYRQDAASIQCGTVSVVSINNTPSTIIAVGLDLEEEQLQLRSAFTGLETQSNSLRRAKLVEAQARMRRRIDAWHDLAQLLMPCIKSFRTRSTEDIRDVPAQDLPLFLPSVIHTELSLPDDRYLLEYELRLREAQAYDTLAELRGYLGLIAYMDARFQKYPDVDRAERAKLVVDIVQAKIALGVIRYRSIYAAITRLALLTPEASGQAHLQDLKDSDVRYMSQMEADAHIVPSWIWRFGRTPHLAPTSRLDLLTNLDLNEAFRVEWCHAHAQAQASAKKFDSIRQEMDRAVAYHRQRARWWEAQVGYHFDGRPDYFEGANSYARQQSDLCSSMKDQCSNMWMCISGGRDD